MRGRDGYIELDDVLALLDWKRTIFQLYAEVRVLPPQEGWELWRSTRDRLFASHPQSPLPEDERAGFSAGVPYFPYDPAARVLAEVEPAARRRWRSRPFDGDVTTFERVGRARFELHGQQATLDLYWLEGYGGGLFLPFADATSGGTTYGAGRYLLDTVKGADLGMDGARIVLDFNYAYNPSCAYDPRWVCPLAPAATGCRSRYGRVR